MRPRRLLIEGLRSFRRRVELDFGDRQLIAIVGDTGVGKSSILEAITYALYGGATWTAHHGDLISDTTDDMLVELAFDADGKQYRIRRTASETNRPSTAELINETDGEAIDDVRPVNEAVRKLIGLDRNAFLKTVILPQGRFAELLQAEGADRNKVLKNIFRVDELEQVRQYAKTIRDRVYPQIEGIKQRRAALPDDPEAALAEARDQRKQADARAGRLAKALKEARTSRETLDQAIRDADQLQAARSALEELALPDAESRLDAIIASEDELSKAGKKLDDEVASKTGALAELKKRRTKATEDGLDAGVLSSTLTRLEGLIQSFPEVSADLKGLRSDIKAHARAVAQVESLSSSAEEGALAVEEAAAAADAVARTKTRSDSEVAKAELLLQDFRAAEREAIAAGDAAAKASEEVDKTTETNATADAELTAATEDFSTTEAALRRLEREHAAAHAAADVGPGDPCPICTRELPEGFKRPKATGLKSAQSRHDKAAKRLHDAQTAASRADQAVEDAASGFRDAQKSLTQRERHFKKATSQLAKQLGVDEIDATATDQDLLTGLRTAAETAATAALESTERLAKATEAADAARASLRQHEQHIAAEQKRIDSNRERLQKTMARLKTTIEALPQSLRPPLLEDPDIDTVDLKQLRLTPLKRLAESAQKRLDKITALDTERDELCSGLDSLREQLAALDEKRAAEVVEPLAALRDLLLEATHTVNTSAKSLGTDVDKISLSKERSTSSARRDLQALADRVTVLLETAAVAEAETEQRQADARKQLSQVLDSAGAKDLEAMEAAKANAGAAKQTAATQVKNAREAAATAKELEKQLGEGGQLVDDLEHVMDLLTNRTFIGAILAQRSKALLAVASKRLEEMTGERYAFTSDFEILDELTGQPRDARTLSGGESFLASLALALGMVDLASRSGGRLDALFLDEGFGALDASNLHSAVDALQATSSAGRMVAVISHVKAIAERIDDVMVVMSKPHGSDVAWLDGVARESLAEGDIQDALDRLLE